MSKRSKKQSAQRRNSAIRGTRYKLVMAEEALLYARPLRFSDLGLTAEQAALLVERLCPTTP